MASFFHPGKRKSNLPDEAELNKPQKEIEKPVGLIPKSNPPGILHWQDSPKPNDYSPAVARTRV